jgi:hypothetical protein
MAVVKLKSRQTRAAFWRPFLFRRSATAHHATHTLADALWSVVLIWHVRPALYTEREESQSVATMPRRFSPLGNRVSPSVGLKSPQGAAGSLPALFGDLMKPSWLTKARAKLAATGFVQVIFVAANTVFIAHYELVANVVTAFAISYIWTHNVKKVAFGDEGDRWFYATGAALGSVCGTVLAGMVV